MGKKSRPKQNEPPNRVPQRDAPAAATWPAGLPFNLGVLTLISLFLFRELLLHPTSMLWASDIIRLHSTFKAVQFQSLGEYGRFPLWDPTMLCGRSIVGDPLTAILNPMAWLFWVTPSAAMFGLYLWFYTTLGAWGAFLWIRTKGAEPIGALVTAIAFAFSGKTAAFVFAGHMETLPTMLCAPWAFWAVERILQRRTIGSAITLGAVWAVTASIGHMPSLYWNALVVGLYAALHLAMLAMEGGWAAVRRPLGLCLSGVLVFLVGAVAWWLPTVRQTLLLSARAGDSSGSYDFSTMGSATTSDLLRLIWPFHGITSPVPFASDSQNGFFWETASYPGLVALALACFLVISIRKDRRTVIFGALALLALVLALGRNTWLYRVAYELVPGLSLLRVPGRLLFFSNLFLAGMAGLGMTELLRADARRRWSFAVVVAVLWIVAVGGSTTRGPASTTLAGDPALAIIVLLALLFTALAFAAGKVSVRVFGALILGVCLLDLGIVWSAHVHTADPAVVFPSNSVVSFLESKAVEGPFRYFDPTETVPQQVAARHGLESITGYHPGIYGHQLELYHALWKPGEGSDLVQLLMHSPKEIACTPLLDLMNVRYVVAYEPVLDDRFVKVFTTPAGEFATPRSVHERKDPLPRAFVVPTARPPESGSTALQAVCAVDPRQTCILDGEPIDGGASFQPVASSTAQSGELRLDFHTEAPGVLVVSESWHPDWVATDRGEPVAVRRANGGFLGIPIGTGSHDVHVRYRPWDFLLGCWVSGVFWVGLGAVATMNRWRARRGGAPGGMPVASDVAPRNGTGTS